MFQTELQPNDFSTKGWNLKHFWDTPLKILGLESYLE